MNTAMPPGHNFELFFPVWNETDWTLPKDKKFHAIERSWHIKDSKGMLEEMLKRQRHQADLLNENILSLDARSTAPFLTGIGIEHPLENGFSFLKPYGLPYLPGSGVKGVLKKACEELALVGEHSGAWNILEVWSLFGFEGGSAYLSGESRSKAKFLKERACSLKQSLASWVNSAELGSMISLLEPLIKQAAASKGDAEAYCSNPKGFMEGLLKNKDLREKIHNRGALVFWDVFPMPPGDTLSADILTPHYGHYYQDGKTPHDSGQPVPNQFLTVPPGSLFRFHVQYAPTGGTSDHSKERWKAMLGQAFAYAFDWLGFGAKTAVGYGQMTLEAHGTKPSEAQGVEAEKKAPSPKSEPPKRQTWENAHLTYSPGNQTITATFQNKKAEIKGKIEELMPPNIVAKIKKKKSADTRVMVEPIGNSFIIISIG